MKEIWEKDQTKGQIEWERERESDNFRGFKRFWREIWWKFGRESKEIEFGGEILSENGWRRSNFLSVKEDAQFWSEWNDKNTHILPFLRAALQQSVDCFFGFSRKMLWQRTGRPFCKKILQNRLLNPKTPKKKIKSRTI